MSADARQGTDRTTRDRQLRLGIGVAISALGFALHHAVEFGWRNVFHVANGLLPLVGAQTVMVLLYPRQPRAIAGGLLATAVLQILGGAILSVLPLSMLPFAPAQDATHYTMHVVYGVAQVPLLHAGWREIRRR